MKKLISITIAFLSIYCISFAQTIPDGISFDTIPHLNGGGHTGHEIYYYKPATYDSLTSPILWAMHGLGGDGSTAIGWLQNIADSRNLLIVAPTAFYSEWSFVFDMEDTCGIPFTTTLIPLTVTFK